MSSLYERKIKDGARPLLDEGEEVIATLVARPRGWTQAMAGSIHVGAAQQGKALAAGEQAGLELASPMALALTQRRLVVLRIGSPIGLGIGGKVKELVSAVPLERVDGIDVKRLLLGQVVTVTVDGQPIKLEANALAGGKALAGAFNRAASANPEAVRA
jgi:hypothetical protein